MPVSTINSNSLASGQTLSVNGITFPATQVPSANANTLDDYEEGSWTPTDASGASLSFTVLSGNYLKVGKLVFVSAYLDYPSTANSTQAKIGGLPFTAASNNSYAYLTGRSSYSGKGQVTWQVNSGATSMPAHGNGGPTNVNNNDLSSAYIIISGCYLAAD